MLRKKLFAQKAVLSAGLFAAMAYSCADGASQAIQASPATNLNSISQVPVDDCAPLNGKPVAPCPHANITISAVSAAGAQLQGSTGVPVDWAITAVSTIPARRVLLSVTNVPSGLTGQLTNGAALFRIQGTPTTVITGTMTVAARDLSQCEQAKGVGACGNLLVPESQFDAPQQQVQYAIIQGTGTTGTTSITSLIMSTLATGLLNQAFTGTGLNIGGLLGGGTTGYSPYSGYPNTGYSPNTGYNYPNQGTGYTYPPTTTYRPPTTTTGGGGTTTSTGSTCTGST